MARPVTELEMKVADKALREAIAKYEALTKRAPFRQLCDCAWALAASLRKGTRVAKKYPKVVERAFGGKRPRSGLPSYWFVKDDVRGGWKQRRRYPQGLNPPDDSGPSPVFYPTLAFSKADVENRHRRSHWGAARIVWFKCVGALSRHAGKGVPSALTGENPDPGLPPLGSARVNPQSGEIVIRSLVKYATQALRKPLSYYKVLAARGIEGRIEHVLKKDAAKCGLRCA